MNDTRASISSVNVNGNFATIFRKIISKRKTQSTDFRKPPSSQYLVYLQLRITMYSEIPYRASFCMHDEEKLSYPCSSSNPTELYQPCFPGRQKQLQNKVMIICLLTGQIFPSKSTQNQLLFEHSSARRVRSIQKKNTASPDKTPSRSAAFLFILLRTGKTRDYNIIERKREGGFCIRA